MGSTEGLQGCRLAKPPACGSMAWVGWMVGFCSCSMGMQNLAVRAACGCERLQERDGKNHLSAEAWLYGYIKPYGYKTLYSRGFPSIFFHP